MAIVTVLEHCNSKFYFGQSRKVNCNDDNAYMLLECQRGKEEIVGCLPYSSHYENLKKL
jgi:hypothetical protein